MVVTERGDLGGSGVRSQVPGVSQLLNGAANRYLCTNECGRRAQISCFGRSNPKSTTRDLNLQDRARVRNPDALTPETTADPQFVPPPEVTVKKWQDSGHLP